MPHDSCEKERGSMDANLEEQKLFYDERWSHQMFINPLQMERAYNILGALVRLKLNTPQILDFGCGTGWLASILNHVGPVTGIELSEKAVTIASEKYPGIRFICADLFHYELDTGQYDLIVSQEVLEHVRDQRKYIHLIGKYLKRGGYLILTTPNSLNMSGWSDRALAAWKLQPIENWVSRQELRSLLSKEFNIIKMKTIIPIYGNKGLFRIISSFKLNHLLHKIYMKDWKDRILLRLGFGLHFVVVARRL